MIEPLMLAAARLAEALRAENEALARLDLAAAAELATAKRQASDAFTAAYDAASRTGSRAEGPARTRAEEIAVRLRDLTSENRRLLERAIDLQSRVIETIAGAAKPAGPGTYGERGLVREGRPGAISFASRI
jgi:multidrug efflux pump subunit AcrA (membrane-fusion protein)